MSTLPHESALALPDMVQRNRAHGIKGPVGVVGGHAGLQQVGQFLLQPDAVVILEIADQAGDAPLETHGRAGLVKLRLGFHAMEADVLVINPAFHRVSA